jgi:hypothetical protein
MKSDGVRDVFKWMEKQCKEQKERVNLAEKKYNETKRFCQFEDEECILVDAKIDLEREKAKLDALVKSKISIEKYMKKLKHQGK